MRNTGFSVVPLDQISAAAKNSVDLAMQGRAAASQPVADPYTASAAAFPSIPIIIGLILGND